MKNNAIIFLLIITGALIMSSCDSQKKGSTDKKVLARVKTTRVLKGDIQNKISLNGKTVYLKKNTVVSPISGYVVKININYGDRVTRNEVLFEVETKEHRALEQVPGFDNSTGLIRVNSPAGGVVSELPINEAGGFVTEGSTLCSIVENRDLMVRVDVPFQYNNLIKPGTHCTIVLADNSLITGTVFRILPMVNATDQTQAVLIKPEDGRQLPENLNLTVQFVNEQHHDTKLVERNALMTNETQGEFWVMKVVDGNLAVKIPVSRGLENDSLSEVIAAKLHFGDTIISDGAYGMPDSTSVKIEK